jgi:hypothetical protein
VVVGYLLDGFRMCWVVMVSFGLCCAGTVPLPLSCATVTSGPFLVKTLVSGPMMLLVKSDQIFLVTCLTAKGSFFLCCCLLAKSPMCADVCVKPWYTGTTWYQ